VSDADPMADFVKQHMKQIYLAHSLAKYMRAIWM
jgi:hypothetical protein